MRQPKYVLKSEIECFRMHTWMIKPFLQKQEGDSHKVRIVSSFRVESGTGD